MAQKFLTNIRLIDDAQAQFGHGGDLKIWHDSGTATSYISDQGSGDLYIQADSMIRLESYTGTEKMATFHYNGAVKLYYDNSLKFQTTSAGAQVGVISSGTLNENTGVKLAIIGDGGNNNDGLIITRDNGSQNQLDQFVNIYNDGTATFVASGGTSTHGTFDFKSTNDKGDTSVSRLAISAAGDATFAGNVIIEGDDKDFHVKSADHTISRIINRGSGADLDKGLFSLMDTGTEDIRIDTGGNSWIDTGYYLGIGTVSPSRQLHIKNTSGDNRAIFIENTVAASYAEVQIKAAREFRIGTGGSGTSANAASVFYVYDATAGGTAGHRFEISSDGDVQARRVRSNTVADVALSVQPTDSTIHYGFRIDQATNSFNLDRVDTSPLQLLRLETDGDATFAKDVTAEGGILYLGKADTASGHINSKELMTFNIDTDNDDTNRYFGFYVNGESGSGTELLKIEETGNAEFAGTVTATYFHGNGSNLTGVTAEWDGSHSGDGIFKTGDGAILHIQTSETTVVDGDVLGSIKFSAPDEASGTDAILTGAEITAVAEGTFAADNNATELLFKVGASEAAATALTIASTKNATFEGDVTVNQDLIVGNAAGNATTAAFGTFDQLRFDNSYNDSNRGPNKIVMHDNAGAWIGGFGIHTDTVAYYTGATHKFYKTTSQTGSTELLKLESTGATVAGSLGIAGSTAVASSALTIKSTSTSSQPSAIDIIQNGSGTNSIIRMGEKSTDGGRFHMFDGGTEKIAFYTDGTDNHISAGNLAIGSNSAGGKLDITQSSATDPVLRLTDDGVANYDFIFPDTSTIKLETDTSSTKTFKLLNAGDGDFNFEASSATFSGQVEVPDLFVNCSANINSSSEKLSVSGMSTLSAGSDSAASLYVKNTSTTTNTFQPYIYFADPGGNRAGFGVETSTAKLKINSQNAMLFTTGSSSLGGTLALTLDTSQNATFEKNVLLQSDGGNAQKYLAIYNEGTATHDDVVLGFKTHGSRQYSIGIDRSTANFTLSNLYASVSSGVLLSVDNSGNANFTGTISTASVGGDGTPIIDITGTASDTFNWITKATHENLAAGEHAIHIFGKEHASKNSAHIGFTYNSDHGDDNTLNLGFFGVNDILNVTAGGKVGIGLDNPSSKLHIRTSTNFNYEFEEVSSKLRLSALNDARNANVPLEFAASSFGFLTGDTTFAANILMGNTVVNPASGFADQTGIGLKYSTTVPEVQISSDSTALQLNRTSTGGAGQIMTMRHAATVVHDFRTNYYGITAGAPYLSIVAKNANSFVDPYIELVTWNEASGASSGKIALTNGAWNSNDMAFYTEGNNAVSEKMRILGGGNVGIGVDDPDAKLEIKGSGGSTGLTFKTTDASSNQTFFVQDGGRVGVRYYPLTIGIPASSDPTSSGDRLYVSGTGGDVVISSEGNLGLGAATDPGRKLHIDNTASTATASAYFYTNAQHTGSTTQAHVSIYSDHASSTGQVLYARGDGTGDLLYIAKSTNDRFTINHLGNTTINASAPGNSLLTLQYNSTQDSPATVDNGDIIGAIHFKGIDDSASSAVTGVYGKILATADGLWDGSGNRGIDLSFHTGKYSGGSVSTAAALTLDQNQNATFAGGVIIAGDEDRITAEGGSMYLGGGNGNTTLVQFSGHAIPDSDSSKDLGTTNRYWRHAYIDAMTTTGNVTIGGDLQVNGTTTTVNQTNLDVADNIIGLNRGLTGTNANDSGIIIERGSSGDNAAFIWDESVGYFSFGTTQKTPSATGAVANESDWTWKPVKASGAHFKTATDSGVSHGVIIERSNASDKGYINYQGGAFRMVATDGDPIKIGHVSNDNRLEITSGGDVKAAGQVEIKHNAGIYSFSHTVGTSSSEEIFRLDNSHGAQAFRVTFVCSTSGYSVAKTFEVVHQYGAAAIFSKVVDTGAYGAHDFTVAFANDNDSAVKCTVSNGSSSINANIVTTVFLGGSPTDITVTEL